MSNNTTGLRTFIALFWSVALNLSFGLGALVGYIGGGYLLQMIILIIGKAFNANGVLLYLISGLIVCVISMFVFVSLLCRFPIKKLINLFVTNPSALFKYMPIILALGLFVGICIRCVLYIYLLIALSRLA